MAIFYFGEILLSGLVYADVIKGTDGTHSSDNLPWTAEEVKSGIYVIIVCVTMCIAMLLMIRYFNVDQRMAKTGADDDEGNYQQLHGAQHSANKLSAWMAFVDAYLAYIPEFLRNVLCCGVDSYRLARKRIELRARKKRGVGLTDAGEHMLSTTASQQQLQLQQQQGLNPMTSKESYQEPASYPMAPSYPPTSHYPPQQQPAPYQ